MARRPRSARRGWQPRMTRCRACYDADLPTYIAVKCCADCAQRYASKNPPGRVARQPSGTAAAGGGGEGRQRGQRSERAALTPSRRDPQTPS